MNRRTPGTRGMSMAGQRAAQGLTLLLVLAASAAAGAPPLEECPPTPPGALHPVAVPPGGSQPVPRPSTFVRSPAENDLPVPAVAIRVRAPAESAPGQEVTYRLTAENCSKVSAHHVTVRVTL